MNEFLADENIPLETITALRQKRIDVRGVSDTRCGLDDGTVLNIAHREHRVLITFDADFGELIFRERRPCHGVILLRLHPQSPEQITAMLLTILSLGIDFKKSFCVVERHRIRVIPLFEHP